MSQWPLCRLLSELYLDVIPHSWDCRAQSWFSGVATSCIPMSPMTICWDVARKEGHVFVSPSCRSMGLPSLLECSLWGPQTIEKLGGALLEGARPWGTPGQQWGCPLQDGGGCSPESLPYEYMGRSQTFCRGDTVETSSLAVRREKAKLGEYRDSGVKHTCGVSCSFLSFVLKIALSEVFHFVSGLSRGHGALLCF